ncbi:MAG TPA: mechanosensitive ion channel family protein [Clostridia bacterium]|nr:mechanosensitive ion channel family protein [Clostridia bacterium]
MENGILQYVILNNTVYSYLLSILIVVIGFFIIKTVKYLFFESLQKRIKKISFSFGDFFYKTLNKRILPMTYFVLIFIAITRLNLIVPIERIIDIFFILLFVLYVTLLIQDIIIYTMKKYWEKKQSSQAQDTVFTVSVFIVRLVTWLIAILFILDNLNIEIRGLITGLGIGGIAIAFAAQTILADIFSYFTIFLDRPFDIGDFIIIGDYKGVVEHIGIKTTRVRSLSGEQLVFSNNDLTNSRINNYKRMKTRRINFDFGVVYDTPLEKLKKIPQIVEEIITKIEKTDFDRAHFASYGEYSLIYQVVYYVNDSDYKVYMDLQEVINLKLKERFLSEGIEFAYPTHSLHIYDKISDSQIEPIDRIRNGTKDEKDKRND